MEWAGTIGGAAGVVLAMIQVLKHSSLGTLIPSRDWGLVAIGLGIVWTLLIAQVPGNEVGSQSPAAVIALGVIAGLTASGAYGTGKEQASRRDRPTPTTPSADAT